MSDPKLLQLTKEISTRLQAIKIADGYHTDMGNLVVRGRLVPKEEECPMVAVTIGVIEPADDSVATSYNVTVTISVTGFSAYHDQHPEDLAIKMSQDIHRALELPYNPVGRKDNMVGRIKWQGEEVDYPESAGNVVAVTLAYNFSFSRPYGDPLT